MEILESAKRKANKEHVCDFCRGLIFIGEEYDFQKNKFDGSLYTWKTHIKCSKVANELNMYDNCDEGLNQDDFEESINETIYKLSLEEKVNTIYKCIIEKATGLKIEEVLK